MSALGVYLSVSLLYVMGTIIEFAIVLFLQRKHDFHREIHPEKMEKKNKKKIYPPGSNIFSVKIDTISFILFTISYIIFNAVYWFKYLNF